MKLNLLNCPRTSAAVSVATAVIVCGVAVGGDRGYLVAALIRVIPPINVLVAVIGVVVIDVVVIAVVDIVVVVVVVVVVVHAVNVALFIVTDHIIISSRQ